jgi:hypothetical protein
MIGRCRNMLQGFPARSNRDREEQAGISDQKSTSNLWSRTDSSATLGQLGAAGRPERQDETAA